MAWRSASDMTKPFRSKVFWWQEASYKAGNTGASGGTHLVSDVISNARIDTGDVVQSLRTISEPSVSFATALVDYMFHLEWDLQPQHASLATMCTNRTCGDLGSVAFEVLANLDWNCSTTTFTVYHLYGCKCKTITVSATKGENWKCVADFSVGSISYCTTTITGDACSLWVTAASHEADAEAGSALAAFNTAGDITWDPESGYDWYTGAYVTNSFSVTIDNNLNDHYIVGSSNKQASIPGGLDVSAVMDISMEFGGGEIWELVIAGVDIDSVILNTGLTGAGNLDGKLTLEAGRINTGAINIETGGEGMVGSVPFTFRDLTWAVGT